MGVSPQHLRRLGDRPLHWCPGYEQCPCGETYHKAAPGARAKQGSRLEPRSRSRRSCAIRVYIGPGRLVFTGRSNVVRAFMVWGEVHAKCSSRREA